MAKKKLPHRKHQLRPLPAVVYSPPRDKAEGTDVRQKGYHPGSAYSPSELAFIQAVDAFRRRTRRKFLSAVDHLRIVASLGWLRLPAELTRPHLGDASEPA